jgi:hypothetical protein
MLDGEGDWRTAAREVFGRDWKAHGGAVLEWAGVLCVVWWIWPADVLSEVRMGAAIGVAGVVVLAGRFAWALLAAYGITGKRRALVVATGLFLCVLAFGLGAVRSSGPQAAVAATSAPREGCRFLARNIHRGGLIREMFAAPEADIEDIHIARQMFVAWANQARGEMGFYGSTWVEESDYFSRGEYPGPYGLADVDAALFDLRRRYDIENCEP